MFLSPRGGASRSCSCPCCCTCLCNVRCLRSVPGSCSDPESVPAAPKLPLLRSWLLQRFRTAAELCP